MEVAKGKGVEDNDFKLWYTGTTSSLKDGVVFIKRQGDRIILVKFLVGDLVFNVISAYAPQISLNESVKIHRSWTHWLVVCPSLRSSL
jgi:hypothetical protein